MKIDKTLKNNERNYVEKPFLDQLYSLGWEILDLDKTQHPQDSHREDFSQVILLPILHQQLKQINPWLEPDQIEEVSKKLTDFPNRNLLENNASIFNLLQENTTVSENRKTGEKSPTVKYIDFDRLENNSFIAICQFKVKEWGQESHIIPDIVLFLNGLPVVLIECKSSRLKRPLFDAIDQIKRYSNQRSYTGEGNPELFYYNQIIIATCRHQAKFGTITTPREKDFYRWSDPYPRTLNDLDRGDGFPSDQQRLVAGMCDRANLLEILRNFTLFSTNNNGQTIKIVGRYQQFRAVKKALKRLLEAKTPKTRSGIIWHTQGSGKSLTMMFMVRAMYRDPHLCQWKIVFITDRSQLERQLSDTGQKIGFTVNVANSIATLKKLLGRDSSDLVMAMIHKFQERDLQTIFPELNRSTNILILTDEAHRSQYSLLGANLDRALPNATRIGYTGTPIDKTEKVFGDYIDKYTMRQSIDDKVTLEIVYEGRTHNAEIPDREAMDAAFADVFSDYNLPERMQILGYGSRDAYLEAESTIAAKARDMLEHYLTHIFPNGYKAQVVATSREAAVRYKTHLDAAIAEQISRLETANPHNLNCDRLKRLKTDVIISGNHNDPPHLKPYTQTSRQDRSIASFKLPFEGEDNGINGDIGIAIVNNMLLTGFDAPIEQVMYLDRIVQNHGLLQAIARVNRVAGEYKEKGYVIDYVGIGHHLTQAIETYKEREQKEIKSALSFPEEEIRQLESDYRAILDLLSGYGITDLEDLEAFYDLFGDEEIRFEFRQAFARLTRSLNQLFPAKEALQYIQDYQKLLEISDRASLYFQEESDRPSMKGIPPKLRHLTDTYLASRGLTIQIKPISILDEDFADRVATYKRTKTKAAAVEHALRHHIEIELANDPELQASFAAALAAIFENFKDNWGKIYAELEKLRQRIKNIANEPTYGLDKTREMPFFRMFKRECFSEEELDEEAIAQCVALTRQVFMIVERELNLVGFWESPARNKLRSEIKQILLSSDFMAIAGMMKNRDQIITRVMEIAESRKDIIRHPH